MLTVNVQRPAKKKSVFRRVSEWLHLWLGLFSAIIVFVVCLTGGLWVFRYEVYYFTEPYQRVDVQQKPYLLPSQLISLSLAHLTAHNDSGAVSGGVTYGKAGKSVICNFELPGDKPALVYLNPYTGKILKVKREASGAEKFFIFVRAGHRFFWLPQKIGSPVVGAACIIFLITLVTGLIWWYPQKWTKKTRDKSFKIKWNAKWKRLNIDLHNVLGFYSLVFIFILTVTGVVFTFDWFGNGVYKALTWKKREIVKQYAPYSDTTLINKPLLVKPEDKIWNIAMQKHGERFGRMIISLPEKNKETYEVDVFFGDGTLIYDRVSYFYDQYTLKSVKLNNDAGKPYQQLSTGEKLFKMNFDIHTGQILGLPTKILAFIACIIGASLPITGFIIWYNRKWGKKRVTVRKRAEILVKV